MNPERGPMSIHGSRLDYNDVRLSIRACESRYLRTTVSGWTLSQLLPRHRVVFSYLAHQLRHQIASATGCGRIGKLLEKDTIQGSTPMGTMDLNILLIKLDAIAHPAVDAKGLTVLN